MWKLIWDNVFKNGPSKICGRQSLKNLKRSGLLKFRPLNILSSQSIKSKFLLDMTSYWLLVLLVFDNFLLILIDLSNSSLTYIYKKPKKHENNQTCSFQKPESICLCFNCDFYQTRYCFKTKQ